MRFVLLVATIAAAVLAFRPEASAAPDDPAAATKPYSSPDGGITISLPAAWTLAAAKREQAAMAWEGELPDHGGPIAITLYHLPGMMNARVQPFVERDVQPGRYGLKDPAHPETELLPHLWMDEPVKGAPTVRHVWMYRVIRRNGFTASFECNADAWPRVREQCLRAGLSLTTTLDEWPVPPAGYKRRVRDGIVYYVHAAAGDADAAVHAVVRDEQQAFAKLHGPPPPAPDAPMVVVHAKAQDAEKLSSAAASAPSGELFDGATWRLFAVAPAKDDVGARARLAREARQLVFEHAMGGANPYWLFLGESVVAWNEVLTDKPLPCVPAGFAPKPVHRFDALAALVSASNDDADAALVYLALFLRGPKVYRDAFAAFLKDVAATGDADTAQKARLLSLDQEKLWSDANDFIKELKQAKSK